jgi:hypothetical protein
MHFLLIFLSLPRVGTTKQYGSVPLYPLTLSLLSSSWFFVFVFSEKKGETTSVRSNTGVRYGYAPPIPVVVTIPVALYLTFNAFLFILLNSNPLFKA